MKARSRSPQKPKRLLLITRVELAAIERGLTLARFWFEREQIHFHYASGHETPICGNLNGFEGEERPDPNRA
jgi:hypothetical protein